MELINTSQIHVNNRTTSNSFYGPNSTSWTTRVYWHQIKQSAVLDFHATRPYSLELSWCLHSTPVQLIRFWHLRTGLKPNCFNLATHNCCWRHRSAPDSLPNWHVLRVRNLFVCMCVWYGTAHLTTQCWSCPQGWHASGRYCRNGTLQVGKWLLRFYVGCPSRHNPSN